MRLKLNNVFSNFSPKKLSNFFLVSLALNIKAAPPTIRPTTPTPGHSITHLEPGVRPRVEPHGQAQRRHRRDVVAADAGQPGQAQRGANHSDGVEQLPELKFEISTIPVYITVLFGKA